MRVDTVIAYVERASRTFMRWAEPSSESGSTRRGDSGRA